MTLPSPLRLISWLALAATAAVLLWLAWVAGHIAWWSSHPPAADPIIGPALSAYVQTRSLVAFFTYIMSIHFSSPERQFAKPLSIQCESCDNCFVLKELK
jgi:hypothetical protein